MMFFHLMQKAKHVCLNRFKLSIGIMVYASTLLAVDDALLYNSCRFCHGERGETTYIGKVNPIKRLDQTALVSILEGYQKGEIDQFGLGTLMQAQVKHFTQEELVQLSMYITRF